MTCAACGLSRKASERWQALALAVAVVLAVTMCARVAHKSVALIGRDPEHGCFAKDGKC